MNVLKLVNGTVEHYTSRLPRWANALIIVWLLLAALIYFGAIELPDIGWWRVLVMAPMAIVVLAVLLQIFLLALTWISAPARWLLKKWNVH